MDDKLKENPESFSPTARGFGGSVVFLGVFCWHGLGKVAANLYKVVLSDRLHH